MMKQLLILLMLTMTTIVVAGCGQVETEEKRCMMCERNALNTVQEDLADNPNAWYPNYASPEDYAKKQLSVMLTMCRSACK